MITIIKSPFYPMKKTAATWFLTSVSLLALTACSSGSTSDDGAIGDDPQSTEEPIDTPGSTEVPEELPLDLPAAFSSEERVATVEQIFEVYTGRAFDARLVNFPYLPSDAASCESGTRAMASVETADNVNGFLFDTCVIGGDTLTGSVLITQASATDINRQLDDLVLTFEPDGRMTADGSMRLSAQTTEAPATLATNELSYRFSNSQGSLEILDASTRITYETPSPTLTGGFSMRSSASDNVLITVLGADLTSEADFAFPTSGRVEATTDDGSQLQIEAGNGDPDTLRLTTVAPDGQTQVADEPWSLWEEVLGAPDFLSSESISTEDTSIDIEANLQELKLAFTDELLTELDTLVAASIADSDSQGLSVATGEFAFEILECGSIEPARSLAQTQYACPLGGNVIVVDGEEEVSNGSCLARERIVRYDFAACSVTSDDRVVTLQGEVNRNLSTLGSTGGGGSSITAQWQAFSYQDDADTALAISATQTTSSGGTAALDNTACSTETDSFSNNSTGVNISVTDGLFDFSLSDASAFRIEREWSFAGVVTNDTDTVTITTESPIDGLEMPNDNTSEYTGSLVLASATGAETRLSAFGVPGESLPRISVVERSATGAESAPVERMFDAVINEDCLVLPIP